MTRSIFANDFQTARKYFLEAAKQAGAKVDNYTHPSPGPGGEPLATDVAWLGPRDALRVLMTVSGTHGVEGYCGSGAQIDWLRRGEGTRLPDGTAALLIHALNPYGFAWSRRVTHENVDLNRNWINFGNSLPQSPEYRTVADLVEPIEWNDQGRDRLHAGARAYIKAKGPRAFQQAVSGGQYDHPTGLFYGGTSPTWSRETLTTIIAEHLENSERVGIIDYHSGLGAWGYGELISTRPDDSPDFLRARAWYGGLVKTIAESEPAKDATSASATIEGDWVSAVPALLKGATVTGVAIEFGTVDVLQVLEALVADNWLHHHGNLSSPEGERIKTQLRAAFYPDSDIWRGMILGQSLVACRQAVAGLER